MESLAETLVLTQAYNNNNNPPAPRSNSAPTDTPSPTSGESVWTPGSRPHSTSASSLNSPESGVVEISSDFDSTSTESDVDVEYLEPEDRPRGYTPRPLSYYYQTDSEEEEETAGSSEEKAIMISESSDSDSDSDVSDSDDEPATKKARSMPQVDGAWDTDSEDDTDEELARVNQSTPPPPPSPPCDRVHVPVNVECRPITPQPGPSNPIQCCSFGAAKVTADSTVTLPREEVIVLSSGGEDDDDDLLNLGAVTHREIGLDFKWRVYESTNEARCKTPSPHRNGAMAILTGEPGEADFNAFTVTMKGKRKPVTYDDWHEINFEVRRRQTRRRSRKAAAEENSALAALLREDVTSSTHDN